MHSTLKVTAIIALLAIFLWAANLSAQSYGQPGNMPDQHSLGDQANPGMTQSYPQEGAGPPAGGMNSSQPGSMGQSGRHHQHMKGMTAGQTPQSKEGGRLTATLLDEPQRAKEGEATVKVHVTGVKLTDPDSVNEQPKAGEAHIHYRLDDGPVIATTATKLGFHDLTPGEHRISVMLAGNDHEPLGPEQTLTVTIPVGAAAHR